MPLPNATPGRFKHRLLKRMLYPMLSLTDAFAIIIGKSQPRVPFKVERDPSSTYYNFRVKPEQLEAFREYVNLPADLPLSPIKCVANEPEDYFLTLNVYHVSGIASGVRAEWSTYVTDHQGVRRYMVLEARSSKTSMDAFDIITRASPVEHYKHNNVLTSIVESQAQKLFRADSDISALEQAPYVDVTGEWLEANDYIYWRNGICDRTFYEAGMANPKVKNVPDDAIKVDDQTHWAPFIEPKPVHTLVYETALEFILVPWRNLEPLDT